MANNTILISGKPNFYFDGMPEFYEAQVGSATEQIAGRIGSKGTAQSQAKLYASGEVPILVFDYQRQEGLNATSGFRDREYQKDGEKVDHLMPTESPVVVKGVLKDGESVTFLQLIDPEADTGKAIAHVAGGFACALALEVAAPSGSDDTEFLMLFFGMLMDPGRDSALEGTRVATETVTVTTHVGTLTNTPVVIEYVEASTQTGLGNLITTTETGISVAANTADLTNIPEIIHWVKSASGSTPGGRLKKVTDTGLTVTSDVVTLTDIPVAFLYIEGNYKSTTIHAFSAQTTAVGATDLDACQLTLGAKGSCTLTFHATDAVQTGTVDAAYLVIDDLSTGFVITTGTPGRGEVKITYATTDAMTFHADEDPTTVDCKYSYRSTATTAKKLIVGGTVQQGEVKAVYASKTLTFHATDNVTECKVRYWY